MTILQGSLPCCLVGALSVRRSLDHSLSNPEVVGLQHLRSVSQMIQISSTFVLSKSISNVWYSAVLVLAALMLKIDVLAKADMIGIRSQAGVYG